MQDHGVDVDDTTLMRARTWRWLRCRILGLLAADTRIARHFQPDPPMPDDRP